ncbi:MAG: NAD(P)H-dependent oxidoreductase subunit E [Proteobacteria bacterium]|nr:NAD(P)H-dependent oxidoreductase subunit E [Pseudomonadota bacterium]
MSKPIETIFDAHRPLSQDKLLPVLIEVQKISGALSGETINLIAQAFNLSRAEVKATASFYSDFTDAPRSLPNVQNCQAEACQAMGARDLLAHLKDVWSEHYDIEVVYCLGHCACAPAIRLNGCDHARLTVDRLNSVLKV